MKTGGPVKRSTSAIAAAIRSTLAEWIAKGYADMGSSGDTLAVTRACDVNDGLCEDFAHAVSKKLKDVPSARIMGSDEMWQKGSDRDADLKKWKKRGAEFPPDIAPGTLIRELAWLHFWIYDAATGLHHDSEIPDGVKNPLMIPFFARDLAKARLRGYSRGSTKRRSIKRAPAPSGIRALQSAGDHIALSEKLKRDPLRMMQQAYLLLSERATGAQKRAYLKRAALLKMLVDEISTPTGAMR